MRIPRRALVARCGVVLLTLPFASLLVVNVFLNTWLRVLVNRQPQRMLMTYTSATMVRPGVVEVRDVELRRQGPGGQWLLGVDRATVSLDLAALRDRTLHITRADAHGATYRWRPRLDVPARAPLLVPPVDDSPAQVQADGPAAGPAAGSAVAAEASPVVRTDSWPPIPGLQNPPAPAPEDLYPRPAPWRVIVDDLALTDIRELWIADFRYSGAADLEAAFGAESQRWLAVDAAALTLRGGDLFRGTAPVLRGAHGQIDFELVGADPSARVGGSMLGGVSGTAQLQAEVSDLSFLEYYLQAVPWLRLSGGNGPLQIDLRAEDGAIMPGSSIVAEVQDFVVRYLSYSSVGDGVVRFTVDDELGAPQTRIGVDLLEFAVWRDDDPTPHMQGVGLHLVATSPDVAFDRPFTEIAVVIDLPEATVPDLRVFDSYLPRNIGLRVHSGSGRASAHIEATTLDSQVQGKLTVEGEGVHATLDSLRLTGDVAIHAVVPSGNLTTGAYDVTGSALHLRHVSVERVGEDGSGRRDTAGWWADLRMQEGRVNAGAPTFLTGTLTTDFRDTTPLLTIFSEKQRLPGWVRGLLGVSPATGSARIALGHEVVSVSDLELIAGRYLVLLDLERREATRGRLFAGLGALTVGFEVDGEDRSVHLFNSRRWYDEAGR